MAPRIHFFALDPAYEARQFCGDFKDGDGWTALPHGVTCEECALRLRAWEASEREQRRPADLDAR
jgi:hypothetical protein